MRRDKRQWRELVKQWKQSGETAEVFAAQAGVKMGTLTHWAWQLSYEARAAKARAQRPARASFVEVLAPMQAARSKVERAFEITLPDGTRVVVPGGFEKATLRALLDVLGQR